MDDSDNTCGFAGDHVTVVLTGMDMAHVNVGRYLKCFFTVHRIDVHVLLWFHQYLLNYQLLWISLMSLYTKIMSKELQYLIRNHIE